MKRREGMSMHVISQPLFKLDSKLCPSKLKNIEEQLQELGGKSMSLRYFNSAQDGEDVTGLLNDLQEALSDYMVCS